MNKSRRPVPGCQPNWKDNRITNHDSRSRIYSGSLASSSTQPVFVDAGNFPNSWNFGTVFGMTFQSLGNSQNPLKSGNFGICSKNGPLNSKSGSKIKNTAFQVLFNVFLGKSICL